MVPTPLTRRPASRVISSAISLSLSRSMLCTSSGTGGDVSEATTVEDSGATPTRVGAPMVMPAPASTARNRSPSANSGLARNSSSPRYSLWSTISADSGPDEPGTSPSSHPGADQAAG